MSESIKSRAEVSNEFKWSVSDLFETDGLWEKEFDRLKLEIKIMEEFKNKLTADNLLDCLTKRDALSERFEKVYVYANLRLNEDQTNSFYQGLSDKSDGLLVSFKSYTSFIEPEILAMDEKLLLETIPAENIYRHFIEDMLREKEHILSKEEEEILAKVYEISIAPENIYSMINNADMTFPDITDASGSKTPLTHGKYISFMESADRRVRQDAFNAYYDTYHKQKNTIAATFGASVKKDAFTASVRKYKSSLEASLSQNNIDVAVYKNLIESINTHLPLMHKYISLRKKRLAVSELHMYDLYTPIIPDVDTFKSYPDAKTTVAAALAPLGSEYGAALAKGLEGGWIDVYENKGKRSGAYAWGSYGGHPFVSLNYDDTINNMFTLAHEMGHALHSYYTWSTQPYVYGSYTIFVAEVASTVNECLLMDYLLKTTTDKKQRQYLLNYYLEQFRGTVFRQTMFAEFEMLVHDMVEAGTPLTFDSLCDVYRNLNIKYYGSDIVIDDKISWEWSRIPHFYNAFYVYQYATGFSAAVALSKKILEGGAYQYIDFLKSGSSDYSLNLLKKAGVDMTRPEPVKNAMDVFNDILNQMEVETNE